MTEHFILTFATAGGRTRQVRVSEPNKTIAVGVITAAAGDMIAGNVFTSTSGPFIALKKAEIRSVTREVLI